MVKDQEYLEKKALYCLDLAKKLGATATCVNVGNSISETVNFRNKKLDESNRSDNLAIDITTYIGKKKSSISSSNLLILKSILDSTYAAIPEIVTIKKTAKKETIKEFNIKLLSPTLRAFSNEDKLNWLGKPKGSKNISRLDLKVVNTITIIGIST